MQRVARRQLSQGASRWVCAAALLGIFVLGRWESTAQAEPKAATAPTQSVLGPGLYVFQTRIREASCGDAEPDGYVLSFFAAIDGIPGSLSMKMELVNTAYFKSWELLVHGEHIQGISKMGKAADAPEATFTVTRDGNRFKGTGKRSYNGTLQGKPQRCSVSYDALIKRLDV